MFNQTNVGTVSRTTLGRLLRDRAKRVWAFPSTTMPSWAETETETHDSLGVGHTDVWRKESFRSSVRKCKYRYVYAMMFFSQASRRKGEWRKKVATVLSYQVRNDLCPATPTLVLFPGQFGGDCWETGRSVSGSSRPLRSHVERTLESGNWVYARRSEWLWTFLLWLGMCNCTFIIGMSP